MAAMTHVFPTYDRFGFEPVSGQGVTITDETGKQYLDFTSGIGVCNLGYQHPAVTQAVSDQLAKMWHISNLYNNHLQESVAHLLVGDSDRLAFFANSGTEANEAALKLVRKATGRNQIVSFNHSFHGRTYGSMSMTGNPHIKEGFGPLVPDMVFETLNDPAAFKAVGPQTAAVIVEVIQGEGGVILADRQWLLDLQDKAHQVGALLIIDEVQTGIGRTGTRFAFEGVELDPDIYTSAKGLANGLPVGAMIGKSALKSAFGPGSHGSTFAGNPLTMAAAQAVLTTLTPAFLVEVTQKADQIWPVLASFEDLPAVTAVTGRGLMIGIHLAANVPVSEVISTLHEKGLLTLSAVGNTLRLLPPLVMSSADLQRGLSLIESVLKAV